MPIYEYRCNTCKRKVSIFQRSMRTTVAAACPQCGGSDLTRLVSTFAFHRAAGSLDSDDFDEAALMEGLDEDDPKSVARWARRMGDKFGEDLGPDFDEMVGRMEAGEMDDDGDDDSFDDDF